MLSPCLLGAGQKLTARRHATATLAALRRPSARDVAVSAWVLREAQGAEREAERRPARSEVTGPANFHPLTKWMKSEDGQRGKRPRRDDGTERSQGDASPSTRNPAGAGACRDSAGEKQRGWVGRGLQGLTGWAGKQPVSDGQVLQGSELRGDNIWVTDI